MPVEWPDVHLPDDWHLNPGLMREPVVIQPENGTAGRSRGCFKVKRDMIRDGPDRGGEGGVW